MGVVDIREALTQAQAAALDLVEISPTAEPPVCRIMDFGKYCFELNKRRAVAKKKQKQIQIKEVKFRPATDVGDFDVKIRKITGFLERGDKVKVTVRFRGREMQHRELGLELLGRVKQTVGKLATVEQEAKMEGRQFMMVLVKAKT